MRLALTFNVDCADETDPAKIVEAATKGIKGVKDAEAEVVAHSVALNDSEFVVVGTVKGKPGERWRETVRAVSVDEAERKGVDAGGVKGERVVAGAFLVSEVAAPPEGA